MLLYKTTAVDTQVLTTRPDRVTWQGSQTESSKARTAAKADAWKATTQTVEVPTAKGPLLDWLNANVKA